ncbi:MAG TPA: ATP phosphoribosyltransferase [Chthoniobacteraceae bacterium]|jgi:ATP phosphoribosyltransferase|nr:phosphoribosyltransferase [Chthoniobacter sp.]HEV7868898.1 ATP phosphoribosyltransferase [Chthoniobacteraceae bacterium]
MEAATRVLRVGLPSGSLQEPTFALFAKAGFTISGASRSYKPAVNDPELVVRLLRAQEISRYVEHGFLDCGLTGKDWIANNRSDVAVLAEMTFSKVSNKPTRWVIAVPEDSPIRSVKDLQGKVIATEAVELTRAFLAEHGVTAEVEFSWGATEVKVPDLVDAIVDVTETGSSLRANKLRILETIMESSPQFIANKAALQDPWKQLKVEKLVLLLQGAFAARDKVGLKMNLPEARLAALLAALPALRNPTIAHLATPDWVAVETIIDENIVREIIPQLKSLGAEGIIEYPLNKVVY